VFFLLDPRLREDDGSNGKSRFKLVYANILEKWVKLERVKVGGF
jgi:hypothetical protein